MKYELILPANFQRRPTGVLDTPERVRQASEELLQEIKDPFAKIAQRQRDSLRRARLYTLD